MDAADRIPDLDAGGLRRFGLTIGAIVATLFGVALPYLFGRAYPWWPWAIAGVLAAWSLIAPKSLKPVYRSWMRLGLILNRIVSPVILGIVFFLVITPLGLLMRMTGRDPMARAAAPEKPTYRVRSAVRKPDHLERPY